MHSQQSILLVTLLTITVCSAHIGGGQAYQEASPQVYCGRTLARTIAFMCYGQNTEESKRSESGSMYNAILAPYYREQEEQLGWPWIAPHKARGLSQPSRGKRLVVTECCDKPCSINELLSYC